MYKNCFSPTLTLDQFSLKDSYSRLTFWTAICRQCDLKVVFGYIILVDVVGISSGWLGFREQQIVAVFVAKIGGLGN